jgi:hypothetical protein
MRAVDGDIARGALEERRLQGISLSETAQSAEDGRMLAVGIRLPRRLREEQSDIRRRQLRPYRAEERRTRRASSRWSTRPGEQSSKAPRARAAVRPLLAISREERKEDRTDIVPAGGKRQGSDGLEGSRDCFDQSHAVAGYTATEGAPGLRHTRARHESCEPAPHSIAAGYRAPALPRSPPQLPATPAPRCPPHSLAPTTVRTRQWTLITIPVSTRPT